MPLGTLLLSLYVVIIGLGENPFEHETLNIRKDISSLKHSEIIEQLLDATVVNIQAR